MFKTFKNLWWGLLVLIILSPLGLLATGTAFGEWGMDELVDEVGFIPAGLAKFADFWQHVVLPDYSGGRRIYYLSCSGSTSGSPGNIDFLSPGQGLNSEV
mgnify:CR=1 FL=1